MKGEARGEAHGVDLAPGKMDPQLGRPHWLVDGGGTGQALGGGW